MRIMLDTNVLVDYLICRAPFDRAAEQIVDSCRNELTDGCISSQSVADIFYILRKDFSVSERKKLLLALCEIFTVEGIDRGKLTVALENDAFSDFEDCLQAECALAFRADYIVTRNEKDYVASAVPCISPDVFCERYLKYT